MTCTSCGDKPKGSSKGFPRAVVEINNPESLVLLRKVVIPVSMGTEEDVPPTIGKYFNVLLQYEANGHIYLYSSDGIPTAIEANIPQEVLDRIDQLEIDVDLLETGLANETTAREAADSALSSSINSLSSSLSAETEAREQADAALEGDINNLTADLEEETTARETSDTALGGRIDTVANNLATETANRISADEGLQADIAAEATARANADTALNTAITSEVTARQEADTNLQNQITQETQARAAADTAINGAITAEATARQTADAGLQNQIDAITASSDVKDIVGTKAELNNYDTSTLGDNDIIKVLQDESENNATTYYRWNATTQQFTLIGEEGPYYTKSQADTLLNAKQNTLTAGSNVQIVNDTISATDTTYTAGTGLALNGTQFSVDTTAIATQSDLTAGLATKQNTLTAGSNVQISNDTISATDTTYTAGTGLNLVDTQFAVDTTAIATQTDLAGKLDDSTTFWGRTANNGVVDGGITISSADGLPGMYIGYGQIEIDKPAAFYLRARKNSSTYSNVLWWNSASNGVPSDVHLDAAGTKMTLLTNEVRLGGRYPSDNVKISNVATPQSAQDAATKGYCDARIINGGSTPPTTSTVGAVGTLYSTVESGTGHLYICTSDAGGTYTWQTLI